MNIYEAMQVSLSIDQRINSFNREVKSIGFGITRNCFRKEGISILNNDDDMEILLTYEGDLLFTFEGSSSGEGGFYCGGAQIKFKDFQKVRNAYFANFKEGLIQ